jgi:hypothetical protein
LDANTGGVGVELGSHHLEVWQSLVNILTLGIVHQGVAFPVLWWMLDTRGNSNSDERMRLLETFAQWFPTAKVNYLCTEREFMGKLGCAISCSNLL